MLASRLSVLHVAQSSEYGLGRYLSELLSAERGAGWRVAMAGSAASSLRPRAAALGVSWWAWEARRGPGPSALAEAGRLRQVIARVDPDVVHLHCSKAGLVGRTMVRGRRPTLFQPHGWSFVASTGMTAEAARRWEKMAARWAHSVVCCSRAEREEGIRAGVRARWRVVPNAVDLSRFPEPARGDRAAARHRLDLPAGPLAVCVGRLSDQKGQDRLLSVWPRIAAAVPGAALVLVGDGPDRVALAQRAPAGVRFVGWQGDVRSWLTAADVVVQPSRFEGMSIAVLEALACGRAVVATDVHGMSEAITEGSLPRAGAVVPEDDDAALADAVVARLRSSQMVEAEGQAGRRRVAADHDLRHWAAELLDATERVAGLGRPAP